MTRRTTRLQPTDLALAVPVTLALLSAATGHPYRAIAFALIAVIGLVARVALGERVPRALQHLGRKATEVLSLVVTGAVWALVVAPAWALSSLVRRPGAAGAPGAPDDPSRPYARPKPRTTLRPGRVVVALAVVAVIAAVVVHQRSSASESASPAPTFWSEAGVGQPDAQPLLAEQRDLLRAVADGRLGWRLPEADGRFIQISDGVRATWVPPGPSEVTIWWFGGSAAFGAGQRDDHTIPSELARVAASEGTALEIENRAVSGYVAWQEVGMFSRLLEAEELAPPDVAVFYHRTNDFNIACNRITQGLDPEEPLAITIARPSPDLAPPPQVRPPTECWRRPEEIGRELARGLNREMADARRLGDAYGVEVVEVWQPDIYTMRSDAALQPALDHLDITTRTWAQEGISTALDLMDVPPIDMGAGLDGAGRTIMFDHVHHNEIGARLVAERLWPELTSALGPTIAR